MKLYPAVIAPVVLAIANLGPGVAALKLTMIFPPHEKSKWNTEKLRDIWNDIHNAFQDVKDKIGDILPQRNDSFVYNYHDLDHLENGSMPNSPSTDSSKTKTLTSNQKRRLCILGGVTALCGTGLVIENQWLDGNSLVVGPTAGKTGGLHDSHFVGPTATPTYVSTGFLGAPGSGSDYVQGSIYDTEADERLGALKAERTKLQATVKEEVKAMADADANGGEASGDMDMIKERLNELKAERDNLKYSVAEKVRAMDDADAKERKALDDSHPGEIANSEAEEDTPRVIQGTRYLLSGHHPGHRGGGHAHYAHAYGMWTSTHYSYLDQSGVKHDIDTSTGHDVTYGEPPIEECKRDHYMRTLSYFMNAKVHDYLWDDVCSPIYYNPYVPDRDEIMISWGRENDWSQTEFNIIQILAGTTIANEINLVPWKYHQNPTQLRKDIQNEQHPLHNLMASGDSDYYTLKNYVRGSFVHKFTRKQTGQLLFYIMSKGGVFEFTLRDVGRLGFQLGPFSSESASVYNKNINNNSLSSTRKYLDEGLKICDDGGHCPADFTLNPRNDKRHFNFGLVYDVLKLSVTRHSIFQLENSPLKDAYGHPSILGSVPLMDGGYYPEQAIEGSITYEEVEFLRDYFQAMESIEPVERPGPDSGSSPDLIKIESMINGQPTLRGLVY